MSEYWKSTPKYWCKFCSTYVRDTPLEKRNHEATGKHQGSVQRSLRTIHKDHDIAEREKAKAKAEVDRLNGVVTGQPTSAKDTGRRIGESERTVVKETQKATAEDRKRQMQQLAQMGIGVPEDFRKDMAMAGEWSTVSTRVVQSDGDVKPDPASLSIGVRKRKMEGDVEDEEALSTVTKRKGWGEDVRVYPGGATESTGETDIEALLNAGPAPTPEVEREPTDVPHLKKEESAEQVLPIPSTAISGPLTDAPVKAEGEPSIAPIFFKKRKTKVAKT